MLNSLLRLRQQPAILARDVLPAECIELASQACKGVEVVDRVRCGEQRFDDSMDGGGRPRRELAVETQPQGFHVGMFAREGFEQAAEIRCIAQQGKEILLLVRMMLPASAGEIAVNIGRRLARGVR
jgi:hypothetical protein